MPSIHFDFLMGSAAIDILTLLTIRLASSRKCIVIIGCTEGQRLSNGDRSKPDHRCDRNTV
jgi:hypothetical protein